MKNTAKNLLLLAVSCAAAFLILEVFLAVYNPLGFRVRGGKIILFPYKRYSIENTTISKLEPRIVRSNNSLGFRGAEPPADFEGSLTIVAVGGSTTECFYLPDGGAWPDLLSKELSGSFNGVWVNNAGMDGHTTFGHKVLLTDYLIGLKPKIVVFLAGLNDMGKASSARMDRLLTENSDRPLLSRFFVSAVSKSAVLSLIQNLYLHYRTIKAGLGHSELDLKSARPVPIQPARRLEILREHAGYAGAYKTRIEELVRISRAAGIEPVLATQPLLCGRGRDPATGVDLSSLPAADPEFVNCGTQWEALELYNSATRSAAAAMGVPLVDLAARMPKDSRYFYDFCHFTREGAAEVARIMREELGPRLAASYAGFLKRGGSRVPAIR